jgi:hypothetical protein
MTQTTVKYQVWSDAGDGINAVLFNDLSDAKSAVAHHYGDGAWEEVAPVGNLGDINAWEYFTEEGDKSIARINPVQQATVLDWTALGHELRKTAADVHAPEDMPDADFAYQFLLDNPECFGCEEWPEDMPQEANIELIAAYYGAI